MFGHIACMVFMTTSDRENIHVHIQKPIGESIYLSLSIYYVSCKLPTSPRPNFRSQPRKKGVWNHLPVPDLQIFEIHPPPTHVDSEPRGVPTAKQKCQEIKIVDLVLF